MIGNVIVGVVSARVVKRNIAPNTFAMQASGPQKTSSATRRVAIFGDGWSNPAGSTLIVSVP